MKRLTILGSTGSIGTQALRVVEEHPESFDIIALAAGKNATLLVEQSKKFKPKYVCIDDIKQVSYVEKELNPLGIEVYSGDDGLVAISTLNEVDMVLVSIVGVRALLPTIKAIEHKKDIALASKEILVAAGHIVMKKVKEYGVNFLPVDSEHAAVMQCLAGHTIKDVENITLTASGGPFFGFSKEEIAKKDLSDALNHPNWSMGQKITIDSASLMNKGLEVIEAHWLFDMPYDKINVIVHRESIIHSMVTYNDGATIAQLGAPDMCMPIQYALCYPERPYAQWPRADLTKIAKFSFYEPDTDAFPCLALAFKAGKEGGSSTVILNAANEEAVALFLDKKIKFIDIPKIIEDQLNSFDHISDPSLEEIIFLDEKTRKNIFKK